MKKRIFSALLALVMVLTIVPAMTTPASAVNKITKENTLRPNSPGTVSGFVFEPGQIYRISESMTINNTGGGPGIKVNAGDAPAVLYIPQGVELTVKGSATQAGIELPEGATLIITGGGTLTAIGGSATRGNDGEAGRDGESGEHGYGGKGGDGGTGGGAGIGLAGQPGGTGGARTGTSGKDGERGNNGQSAPYPVAKTGKLTILGSGTYIAPMGGQPAVAGNHGFGGKGLAKSGTDQSGGGGGGAGGGGSRGYPIGGGGIGGGGGGGGGSGMGGAHKNGMAGGLGAIGVSDFNALPDTDRNGKGGDGGDGGGKNGDGFGDGPAGGSAGYGYNKDDRELYNSPSYNYQRAGDVTNIHRFTGATISSSPSPRATQVEDSDILNPTSSSGVPEVAYIDYTITLNANGSNVKNGSSAFSVGTKTVCLGHSVVPNATNTSTWNLTRTGYKLKGFFDKPSGGTQYYDANGKALNSTAAWGSNKFYSKAGDLTLYAQWEPITAQVTFNPNGGVGKTFTETWTYDKTPAALDTSKFPKYTGYHFSGYYDSTTGGTKIVDVTGSMVYNNGKSNYTSAKTLYAHWTPITYRIQFYNDSKALLGELTDVPYNSVTLPGADGKAVNKTVFSSALSKNGYVFLGWSIVPGQDTAMYESGINYPTGLTGIQDDTVYLYPAWRKMDTYTITYDANGGTGAPPAGTVREDNNGYTLASGKPTRDNYTFQGWATSSGASTANYQPGGKLSKVSGNTILYAVWKQNPRVTYKANGGWFQNSLPEDYPSPEGSYTLTSEQPVRTGYTFTGWLCSVDGKTYTSGAVYNLSKKYTNITFTAQWKLQQHTLTVQKPTDVTLTFASPAGASSGKAYDHGTDFVFNAEGDGTIRVYVNSMMISRQDDGQYHFTLTEDTTLNVTLTPIAKQYIVSYHPNGGVNPPVDRKEYTAGQTVTVAGADMLFRTGYTFQGWNTQADGKGTSYAAGNTFAMPAADTVLYAQWTANQYTVEYRSNGADGGATNSSPMTYDQEGTISNCGFTKTGYVFQGWASSADGLVAYRGGDTVKNLTADPNGTITLFAVWAPMQTKVTLDAQGGFPDSYATMTYDEVPSPVIAPIRTGHQFLGFYDQAGTQYYNESGQPVGTPWKKAESTVTLYAHWEANTYRIHYDGNGAASGSMEDSPMTYDMAAPLPLNQFTRPGYSFLGWSLRPDATASSYTDGAIAKNLSDEPLGVVTLYAVWQPIPTYTVSYDANGGSGAPVASEPVTSGTAYEISSVVPTRNGYTFQGWNEDPNAAQADPALAPGQTIASVTKNYVLYAVWEKDPDTYTISYDANGGSGAPVASEPVTSGTAYEISSVVPTRNGYTFQGWNEDPNAAQADPALASGATIASVTKNYVLYAVWEKNPDTYTVCYDANGGSGGPTDSSAYVAGTEVAVLFAPQPTRDGYTFKGWNSKKDGSGTAYAEDGETKIAAIGENMILYAVWEKNPDTYTISYDANGGSGAPVTSEPVTSGTAYEISSVVPTRNGYTFKGWNEDPNAAQADPTLAPGATIASVTKNYVLYAIWEKDPDTYTVSYDANGASGGPTDSSAYVAGTEVPVLFAPQPTRDGYTFKGWNSKKDGSGTAYAEDGETKIAAIGENVILYAVWEKIEIFYSVTVDPAAASAAEVNIQTAPSANGKYPDGSTVTFTVKAVGQNVLDKLIVAVNGIIMQMTADPADSTQLIASFVVTRDSVITVRSGASTYTVTYDKNGGESPEENETATCLTGSPITLNNGKNYVRSGWHLIGWGTDAQGSGTVYTPGTMIDDLGGDTTLYAIWEKDPDPRGYHYTIRYVANGGSGEPVLQEMYQNLLDTPLLDADGVNFSMEHHTLAGWALAPNGGVLYVLGSTLSAPLAAVDGAVVTLYAVWQSLPTYSVTYHPNGGVNAPTDPQTYYESDTVYVLLTPAPTREGYTFLGWARDSGAAAPEYNTQDRASFVMGNTSVTLYAVWQQNVTTHTVSYDANGGYGAVPIDPKAYQEGDFVTVLFAPLPEQEGYTFLGWAKDPAAKKATYTTSNVSLRMRTDNITLYAVWKESDSYVITYHANAGSDTVSDLPPVGTKVRDAAYTISPLTPSREGYLFKGWSKTSGANNTVDFAPSDVYTTNASLDLYAVWEKAEVFYSVTVDPACASIAEVTVITQPGANGKYPAGSTVTFAVKASGASDLNSLKAAVNGSMIQLSADPEDSTRRIASFTITRNSVISVRSDASTYTVTYDKNGGETPEENETATCMTGLSIILNNGQNYTRNGWHITGWNTKKDGSGIAYALGAQVSSLGQDTTLYAVWARNVDPNGYHYTIRYLANNGTGEEVLQDMYQKRLDIPLYGLDDVNFTKPNSTLIGWATLPGGSVRYALGSRIYAPLAAAEGEIVTLYAVWRTSAVTVTLVDSQGVNTIPSITVWPGSPYGELPVLYKENFVFDGWYNSNGEKVESYTIVTNSAPHTLYARWTSTGGTTPVKPPIGGHDYSTFYQTCPRDETCPAYRFKDLNLQLWYHDGIHFCVENNLMQGLPDNLFAPNGVTTRAQVVMILWRMENTPAAAGASFSDVHAGDWYADAVNWAAANGIVLGDNGNFHPNSSITREQLAAILYRYACYKGYNVNVGSYASLLNYEDASSVSSWALSAMQWACGCGLINGVSGGVLLPQGTATRAQVAAMIMRFITGTQM